MNLADEDAFHILVFPHTNLPKIDDNTNKKKPMGSVCARVVPPEN